VGDLDLAFFQLIDAVIDALQIGSGTVLPAGLLGDLLQQGLSRSLSW